MRVLLDTNVLVSYLLQPGSVGAVRTILRAFLGGQLTLLVPEALLDELAITITGKHRLAKRITQAELTQFLSVLQAFGEAVPPIHEPIPAVTRDPKDDYLLAYALVGAADYLITGDNDLLALAGQLPGLIIASPSQFVTIWEDQPKP
jgi:putative PIN family toxin of toxin-antitoxin system